MKNAKGKTLHPTQQKLLALLKKNIDDPMTMREIQDELNLSSTSVVQHHIYQLEKNGFLRRNPANPKDYEILGDEPERKITYLNLYGLAQCGPNGSILSGDPIDRIPISSRILGFSSRDAFMVKARGDSMKPKIKDKDLVIAKKANDADSGSMVVGVNNGEALIKRIEKHDNAVLLRSVNEDEYPPFEASDDFKIEGIVKSVISYTDDK